ncbi:DUF7146 domain-containing protein [Rhodoligotrophos defluvii]|uniref:DUF7146 domain-containing protein n=1 Tax=Rhodoligotrophos defluvii TaxID=2561934 RepID=UPI0010C9894F|nr:toprim domain-containing protein [Rhodoligotrophos defluvii]
MTEHPAAVLARHLAAHAEDVCRRYLPNGRRAGRYWLVGDVQNRKGRSLYVRLDGPLAGPGAAGKWTDAATGEHGDLLDLIRLRCASGAAGEAMGEARSFLALPRSTPEPRRPRSYERGSTPEAARRLFCAGRPIPDTPAEAYLRARGITAVGFPALRFHPSVYYRAHDRAPLRRIPAMLAAITDLDGRIVGVNRTWLDVERLSVADLDAPRKVLGVLLGHGIRFGRATDRLLAGEGIETVLSLKSVLPELPMISALTANHLAALLLPAGLAQLVIARDNGDAGVRAAARLRDRAEAQGVAVRDLVPCLDDFNDDLRRLGPAHLRRHARDQIADVLLRPTG